MKHYTYTTKFVSPGMWRAWAFRDGLRVACSSRELTRGLAYKKLMNRLKGED